MYEKAAHEMLVKLTPGGDPELSVALKKLINFDNCRNFFFTNHENCQGLFKVIFKTLASVILDLNFRNIALTKARTSKSC